MGCDNMQFWILCKNMHRDWKIFELNAALEEALVNAVYYCSYEERGPVEVRISRDELAILSFPGPDRSIRLADFEAGRAISRRYRNRRIGASASFSKNSI